MIAALRQHRWFNLFMAAFLAVMLTGILYEFYWILLLPAALFLVLIMLLRLDYLALLVVFITPLSINLQKTSLGIGVSLPAEPLIFAVMVLFFIKLLMDGRLDSRVIKHPVSVLILLHLGWMFITVLTSTMFMVSFKSFLARLCFTTVYYFLAVHIFYTFSNIRKFIWLYIIPLLAVIIYTNIRFFQSGMSEKAAHVVMTPFYNDHTAYAAVIAMFIPVLISFFADREIKTPLRIISFLLTAVFVMAIVYSYTRAAWVSLAGALLAYLVFLFRVKTQLVVIAAFAVLGFIMYSWTSIIIKLESNNEQSSTDYREHLQSISNISSDASNVERVNRWLCAVRMFDAKKLTGFGPGTYQFQYGVFQHNDEKTIISTNFGDVGSAHSEYLGPLSEQGLPGLVLFLGIIIMVVIRGSQYIIRTENKSGKILAKGLILGLTTYWVHGLLNYFLDTDKASVPYWGFIAALVALDIFHRQKPKEVSAS